MTRLQSTIGGVVHLHCPSCGWKPEENFYKHWNRTSRNKYCKDCQHKRQEMGLSKTQVHNPSNKHKEMGTTFYDPHFYAFVFQD